jgi:hypothetical protein
MACVLASSLLAVSKTILLLTVLAIGRALSALVLH